MSQIGNYTKEIKPLSEPCEEKKKVDIDKLKKSIEEKKQQQDQIIRK